MEVKEFFGKVKKYLMITQILISVMLYVDAFLRLRFSREFFFFVGIVFVVNVFIFTILNFLLQKLLKSFVPDRKLQKMVAKEVEYNTPVPTVVTDEDMKIVWYNNMFIEILDKKDFLNKKLVDYIKDFDIEEIMKENPKTLSFNNHYYHVKVEVIKRRNEVTSEMDNYYTIFFIDVTEKVELKNKYEESKIVLGYVYIDNYEEITNSIEDTKRPMLFGLVSRNLQKYIKELDGSIKQLERDKFLIILTKSKMNIIIESKFKILEEIRKISIGNDLPVTLSIGMSTFGDTIELLMENAKDAIELAVTRGGNQAVVKKEENIYDFYGAKSKQEIEGQNATKARARIKAYALKEMMDGVSNVIIMGHKNIDLDALGAALGMRRAAKELGKTSYIVLDSINNAIQNVYDKIVQSDEYEDDLFLPSERAKEMNSDNTLLIVVDVNVPSYTECPELIEIMDNVAVIDHHIRGTSFIEKAKVVYLDPFASSSCEAVVHILQYMVEKIKFTEIEVDAMLAGILVDTKNFMFKTGVKTFEAAAFLKKCGAENMRVKFLFQNDFETFKKKARAVLDAQIYKEKTVITVCPSNVKNNFIVVAQIADELLNIVDVEASFVLYQGEDNMTSISARSNGNVNVQIIMEELGGGGHFTAAGVQLKDKKVEEVIENIKVSIDNYFNDVS